MKQLLLGLTLAAMWPATGEARMHRFVVEHRELFAGGAEWGPPGRYERLTGTAYLEVDPRDPLNALIVDLDKAPRNARGQVEFSTPFFVLKPLDMARGNGKIYYTVNNRGNDALVGARTIEAVGRNDFALRQGYTIVDAGWQGDVVPTDNRLGANLPVAVQAGGSAIVGLMRIELSGRNIPLDGAFTFNLKGGSAFRPYETADINPRHSTLTVRNSVEGKRSDIPADGWAFGSCPKGQPTLVSSTSDICLFDGFKPDRIYELIYPAKNPLVMGLGHAATRDVASFLRYEAHDDAGNANPLGGATPPAIRRVYATGASQTGGYLRDFIYLGFNTDESHRKVFDGIIPTIAGTDRVFINVRFADPNVYAGQEDRHDFLQSSYPPFTYAVTTDAVTGIRDGIMKRPATDPFVIQIDSSTEFWQLRASLNVVDASGRPVPIPSNVRLYFSSSTSHGFGAGGLLAAPGGNARCQNPTTPGVGDLGRAALRIMDQWADQGIEPPESNYPRLDDGTLVTLDEARKAFPSIPKLPFPSNTNGLELLDFGPEFGRLGGILSLQPPLIGPRYPILVPKSDGDGLDIAGTRTMQVRVPLGTSTGWNLQVSPDANAPLCGLAGSYLPFGKTKTDRLAARDPRRSLEERYANHAGFVAAVEKGAKALVQLRFLLQEDADRYVAAAKESQVLR